MRYNMLIVRNGCVHDLIPVGFLEFDKSIYRSLKGCAFLIPTTHWPLIKGRILLLGDTERRFSFVERGKGAYKTRPRKVDRDLKWVIEKHLSGLWAHEMLHQKLTIKKGREQ